jgi:hypothetical protein
MSIVERGRCHRPTTQLALLPLMLVSIGAGGPAPGKWCHGSDRRASDAVQVAELRFCRGPAFWHYWCPDAPTSAGAASLRRGWLASGRRAVAARHVIPPAVPGF